MPLSSASNSARPRASAGAGWPAGQPRVVLAGIGVECAPVLFVDLEGLEDRVEGPVPVGQHRVAPDRRQVRAVAGPKHVGDHLVGAAVRHLERREQRDPGLVVTEIDPAVPGQAAGGAVVDALVRLVLEFVEMLGELRHRLQVPQRRRGAQPGWRRSPPPNCTGSALGGAKACSGLWQEAQASWPDGESRGSAKSRRPRLVRASTCCATAARDIGSAGPAPGTAAIVRQRNAAKSGIAGGPWPSRQRDEEPRASAIRSPELPSRLIPGQAQTRPCRNRRASVVTKGVPLRTVSQPKARRSKDSRIGGISS